MSLRSKLRGTSSYMFHVRLFRLQSVSGAFLASPPPRGSESHTLLKAGQEGRWKRQRVLHANQQLREAEPRTVSSTIVENLASQIGIRWHGLATIWSREITPATFLLHVILE